MSNTDGNNQNTSGNAGSGELELSNAELVQRQQRVLLVEKIPAIPVYTGQDPNYSISQFKINFQEVAEFLGWSECEKMFAVKQRLAGAAQQAFLNHFESLKTAKQIFKFLEDRFGVTIDQADLWADFWEFRQANRSVKDYIALARRKVIKLVKEQDFPEEMRSQKEEAWMLSMLVKNLNPEIRRGVIARNPTTLDELENIAVWEEKAFKSTQPSTSQASSVQEPVCAVEHYKRKDDETVEIFKKLVGDLTGKLDELAKEVAELKKGKGKEEVSDKSQVKCFACGRIGHYKKDCRNHPERDFYNNRQPNSNNYYQRGRGGYRGGMSSNRGNTNRAYGRGSSHAGNLNYRGSQ